MKSVVYGTSQGGKRLLFFYEKLLPRDTRVIEWQMRGRRFDPALILGTAGRCRFGCPRVVVCSPLLSLPSRPLPFRSLAPFPTLFWLTCPWLSRRAGAAEADGGVGELARWIERRAFHEWLSFNMDHQRIRLALLGQPSLNFLRRFRPKIFDRLRRGGVGGVRHEGGSPCEGSSPCEGGNPARVKCIHLQTASWLALHRHPAAEWLEIHGLGRDCGGAIKNSRECCFRESSFRE